MSNKESVLMKIKSLGEKCSASYCLLVIKKYIEYCLWVIFLGVQWPKDTEIHFSAFVSILAFQNWSRNKKFPSFISSSIPKVFIDLLHLSGIWIKRRLRYFLCFWDIHNGMCHFMRVLRKKHSILSETVVKNFMEEWRFEILLSLSETQNAAK